MKKYTVRHDENRARLARIEGQIRGIRRMIDEGEYCVDIITQIQAVQAALGATLRHILHKHLDHCMAEALARGSKRDARRKIEEVITVVKRMSRTV